MTIQVLVVDDHHVVRRGIVLFLSQDEEIEVVGEASSGLEAIEFVRKSEPTVILMDLLMPIMDGVTAIKTLKKEFPQVEIVALTSVLEDQAIFDAIQAGAIGYLLKNTEGDKLIESIKAAAEGQVQLSPQVATRLVQEISSPESPEKLTERETDVLRSLAHGLSNKEIAKILFITEKTAKAHISSILRKLNLPSRTRAALYAIKNGLVTLDELDFDI